MLLRTPILPLALGLLTLLSFPGPGLAADDFTEKLVPFLKTYCTECHQKSKASAELDLTRYRSAKEMIDDFRQWEHVVTFVKSGEMPPKKAKQPQAAERTAFLKSLESILHQEALKLAGDPGSVPPRRLTNAEYDYSIHDLTGADIRPAKAFPIDPSSGEGFNNTGEALTMSPNLFKKYYAAGEFVADHLLFTSEGLVFAPHPATTFADRQKYYERAIIRFYDEHQVDLEKYVTLLWHYRHLGENRPALGDLAINQKLSPVYAQKLWDALQTKATIGPMKWLQDHWAKLPAPKAGQSTLTTPGEIKSLVADLNRMSKQLTPVETPAIVANAGNGPIDHLARRRKTASTRDTFDKSSVTTGKLEIEWPKANETDLLKVTLHLGAPSDTQAVGQLLIKIQLATNGNTDDGKKKWSLAAILKEHAPETFKKLNFGVNPIAKGAKLDGDTFALGAPGQLEFEIPTKAFQFKGKANLTLTADCKLDTAVPGLMSVALYDPSKGSKANGGLILIDPNHAQGKAWNESGAQFCSLFPSRFFYVDSTRGLSAGFHLIEGFFRDDQPLYKNVLNLSEKKELDRLWDELYFTTGIWEKMLRGFIFFERSERNFLKHKDFDEFKEEDPNLTNDAHLAKFQQVYLTRSNVKLSGAELDQHPISIFFNEIRTGLKSRSERLKKLEDRYEADLGALGEKAFRRPLTAAEQTKLKKFYRDLAANPELGLEAAVRASVVRLLVSPHFCYRFDATPPGTSVEKLTDHALASRLSYLLWGSLPDAELLKLANAGKLHETNTLRTQIKRMIADPKFGRLSQEFFGQWLGYRDFLSQESVNRQVFPQFNDALKEAMFEEPSRYATYLIQNNKPISQLLNGQQTMVNAPLAKHYDLPAPAPGSDWYLVDGLPGKGRSGVLGMAVFLTKNSQPQRTSPVKRGFWVVHKLLGEHIPPPPPDVAVLPAKETDTDGKTIRQLLKLHTTDSKCAGCHQRFDPIGLAMEGFDPIGRFRAKDLAGRPVDNVVELPNNKQAKGVPEFAQYLAQERLGDFRKTLCQKFLGYALGRSLLLSDQPLLDDMQKDLATNNDQMSTIIERVVLSPQFRTIRSREYQPSQYKPISLDPKP